MRVECEICGAYTEDPNEIEWAMKYRVCPECRHIGSLFIAKEDKNINIKYHALVTDSNDEVHEYLDIEANNIQNAATSVCESFAEDYPDRVYKIISIRPMEE